MKRRPKKQEPKDGFEIVRAVGITLPNVEATTKYDGSPVLKLGGCFMAGLATHPSAEQDTLVVRVGCDEREWLIEDDRGCTRDVLPDGLLSKLSPVACAAVASRSGRPPRLALRVMALDFAQGTKSQPIPTQRSKHKDPSVKMCGSLTKKSAVKGAGHQRVPLPPLPSFRGRKAADGPFSHGFYSR